MDEPDALELESGELVPNASAGEEFRLEADSPGDAAFVGFVNEDVLGTAGLEVLLAQVADVRAGRQAAYEVTHNVRSIRIADGQVTIENDYGLEARGEASLDEFVDFLERVLVELDRA